MSDEERTSYRPHGRTDLSSDTDVILSFVPLTSSWRWKRDLNPCRGICSPLPRLSAIPPRNNFFLRRNAAHQNERRSIRADDGVRTRDLNLGKVPRYQLRYVRINCRGKSSAGRADAPKRWLFCVALPHVRPRLSILDGRSPCHKDAGIHR